MRNADPDPVSVRSNARSRINRTARVGFCPTTSLARSLARALKMKSVPSSVSSGRLIRAVMEFECYYVALNSLRMRDVRARARARA